MWKRFLLGACFSFLAYFSSATFIVQKKANGYSGFEKSKLSFSKLHATSDKIKRAKILNRRGQHFIQRQGKVEFGYTTKLDTDLKDGDSDTITKWLNDEEKVASGIWDKNLMQSLGGNLYRLKLITLQFLTIQLAPSIDVLMWTEKNSSDGKPIFKIESIGYDPNVQVMPGVGVDAKALGIQIDVVGELRLDSKGTGLSGEIGFVSSGNLLPPMRLVPEAAIKGAAGIINRTVANFAVQSFEKGAKEEFAKFKNEIR